MNCVVCNGRILVPEHGIVCQICGHRTCGCCFEALNVPHFSAGHAAGIAVCRTCKSVGEQPIPVVDEETGATRLLDAPVGSMRSSYQRYSGDVAGSLDAWRRRVESLRGEVRS